MRDIFDDLDQGGDIFDRLVPAAPVLAPAAPPPKALPNLFTYRPPARLDIHGQAPAPADQNVQPAPDVQIPLRRPKPSLDTYEPQPTDLGKEAYPGQHLQEAGDRAQAGPVEFGSGFAKGAARAVSMGAYRPTVSRIEEAGAEAGQLAGGMAPLALSAIPGAAPFVIPAMVAQQGLPATAGDVDESGNLRNPAQAAVSVAMAEALAVLPPAVGKSLAARGLTGAGIGELQALVTQAIDAKARGGEVDLTSPESVKDQVVQTLFGLAFGLAHGGEAGTARAPIDFEAPRPEAPVRLPVASEPRPPAPEALAPEPMRAPAEDIFDALAAPEPEAPAVPRPLPEPAPAPEPPAPAPANPREAYMERLREAGLPEEQIQAGMQLVDRAPIRDIFDQVEIRVQEPEPPLAPPERAPEPVPDLPAPPPPAGGEPPPAPIAPPPAPAEPPRRQGVSFAKYMKAREYLATGGRAPGEGEIATFLQGLGDQPVPVRPKRAPSAAMSLVNRKTRSADIRGTDALLRGALEENQATTPVPARALPPTFEVMGVRMTKVKARDPGLVRLRDEKGKTYDFRPDDLVHTGGEVRMDEGAAVPAGEPEEWNPYLMQKGPKVDPAVQQKLLDLHARALAGQGAANERVALGKVGPDMAGYLKLHTGLDLAGMVHTIDNYAIRHIDIQHGKEAKEAPRGQAAITAADIARIPEILAAPDHVERGETVRKADRIIYQKTFEGKTYYVEEVRKGKQELAAVSMWKERAPAARANPEGSVAQTSETFRGPDQNLPPAPGEVNPPAAPLHQLAGQRATGFPAAARRNQVFPGKYDGKPRFEIDDSRAKWTPKAEGDFERNDRPLLGNLAEFLDHPELYRNYPDLRKVGISVRVDPTIQEPRGALTRAIISEGMVRKVVPEIRIFAHSKDQAREFLMHEIQHAIQYEEGHAVGGNWRTGLTPEERARQDQGVGLQEAQELRQKGLEAYHRLAGEIEARDTQSRSTIPYARRRRNFELARRLLKKAKEVASTFDHSAPGKWEGSDVQKKVTRIYDKLETLGFSRKDMIGPAWRALEAGDVDKVAPIAYSSENIPPEKAIVRYDGDEAHLEPGHPEAKGSFHMEGKRAVITLFKGKADFSTWMHEHAHLLRRAALFGADEKTIMRWLEGEGITVADEGGTWTREAEERFARAFERYLRDGKAPTPAVKPLFEKIRQWMREIYQTLRGTELAGPIPEHVRWVFDRLVGARNAAGASRPGGAGEGRLYQDQAPKESYGPDRAGVTPLKLKDLAPVGPDIGHAISYDATPGNPASGWLTPAEKLYTEAVNEAYPIEKIQKVYEKTMLEKGQKVEPDQSIKLAINRVLGSGGSANLILAKRLAPIYQGGEVDGVKYPRLTPDEQRMVDQYLIARDTRWRLDNVPGFENPLVSREQAVAVERAHKARPPELREKIERAADGLVNYGKELVRMKMDAGLPDWTPDKVEIITQNPFYVPEVRDFAKVMAKPAGRQKKNQFTSVNRLVRGTFAVDVDAPVFDPLTALIHDTHQLVAETAKMAVWNRAIDLVEVAPDLKDWIKRMPKDWEPGPSEGVVAVIRPGQIHLEPEQQKIAEDLKRARYILENPEGDEGVEHALKLQRDKILAAAKEGRGKRDLKALEKLLNKVGSRRQAWKVHRQKEAWETEVKFRRLPEAERQMIEDWISEGKPVKYRVPKEIADAVAGMSPPEWAFWQKPAIAAASLFRKMQVGWNPDFTLSNTPRDAQEAYYNVGLKPWFMFKGLYHYFKQDAVYEAFQAHGGSMEGDESGFKPASDMGSDIRYGSRFLKDRFRKLADPKAFEGKKARVLGKEIPIATLARMAEGVKKTAGIPFEVAEAIGEAGEMMTRLGVMDMALNKKKLTPAEAADMARQATLDFKRIGSKMKGANAMVPFLNARIQGMDRMVRTAVQDPAGAATRAFLAAAAPTAALLAWNYQNPYYADIPSSEKEYYWILMKDRKHPFYFKVAKGFLPQLIANPIQMGFENMLGTARKDWWKIGLDVLKSGLPVDDISSALNPVVKIPLEQAANYDFYFDRDIVKQAGRSPAYQFDPGTAETLKTIGRALNLSPQRLQHIAQSLLGGTSTNILFALDLALGRVGAQPEKAIKLEYAPFAKRVLGVAQDWKSDLAQKQRELRREMTKKKEAMRSYQMDIARAEDEGDAGLAARLEKGLEKDAEERARIQEQIDQVQEAMDAAEALKKGIADAYKARR